MRKDMARQEPARAERFSHPIRDFVIPDHAITSASVRSESVGQGITAEDMTTLRWVKPKIVVKVAFVKWTRDGLLGYPELIGARDDKSPREIRREAG